MSTINYLIGSIIEKARKERGLSQKQLAEIVQTSQSDISGIEKGKRNPSIEKVAKILNALQYKFEFQIVPFEE